MSDAFAIEGFAPPRVLDAFAGNFAAGAELGARFSVYREGELIADVLAGHADRDGVVPFGDKTLACIYSSGKAAIAFLMARAASEGKLDFERPIADYWPEFGALGKERVTIAMALSHQAGLCGFADEMPPEDWLDFEHICDRLAATAPLWTPGSASGYHPQTIGFIAGELLRRAYGRTIGAILREDYYRAQGMDIHCGVGHDVLARIASATKPPRPPVHRKDSIYTEIAFLKPWSAPAKVSREDWARAEIPASNMHATAKGLAAIVHPLANRGVDLAGSRVLDKATIEAALAPRKSGADLVLPFDISWAAGLMLNLSGHFGPSRSAYGHAGFGGSAVMIDPEARLSAAYVMNKMSASLVGDERAVRLFNALY